MKTSIRDRIVSFSATFVYLAMATTSLAQGKPTNTTAKPGTQKTVQVVPAKTASPQKPPSSDHTDPAKPKIDPSFKMIKKPSLLRTPQLAAGVKAAEKGNREVAIIYFDSCLAANPKNYEAAFYKGKAFYEMGKFKEAFANIDNAIKLNNRQAVFYYYRGMLQYGWSKLAEAYRDFDTACQKNTRFTDAFNYRGVTLLIQGKYEEALADFETTVKLDSTYSLAYYNKGTCEASLSRYPNAVVSFTRCITLDSTQYKALLNRGNSYLMMQKYDEAIADYDKVMQNNPGNPDPYYNRGVALRLKGLDPCTDWAKAKELGHTQAESMMQQYCNPQK